MKKHPLVTICVPVYNGEKFIIDALESIKSQTYTNFECHIINNASTDKTGELAAKFVENDVRFILHSYDEFVDMIVNWNRSVHYISEESKYFLLVQADDIISPDCLKSHITLMEKHPGAGIASSFRMVGERIRGYGLDYFEGNYRKGKEMLIKHLKGEVGVVGTISNDLYRVEHLKKLPFYPEIFIPEDFHFDSRLALEILLISDLVFSFKILSLTKKKHSESATITFGRKFRTTLHAKENRLNRFRQVFPELDKDYFKVRRQYAFFMLMNYIKLDKRRIRWHKKQLLRKIRFPEYIAGIIYENVIARTYFFIKQRYTPKLKANPVRN